MIKNTRSVIQFVCLLGYVWILAACSKDDSPNNCLLISTITKDSDLPTIKSDIGYDYRDRIAHIQFAGGNYWAYDYPNNTTIIVSQYDANQVLIQRTYYVLNQLGDAKLATYENSTDQTTYEYNTDGYLIKTTDVANGIQNMTIRTIEAGNVTQMMHQTDSLLYIEHYEYYDIVNNHAVENYDKPIFGKITKNLVRQVIFTQSNGTQIDTTAIWQHSYTFDENDRIIEQQIYLKNAIVPFKTISYGYDC